MLMEAANFLGLDCTDGSNNSNSTAPDDKGLQTTFACCNAAANWDMCTAAVFTCSCQISCDTNVLNNQSCYIKEVNIYLVNEEDCHLPT